MKIVADENISLLDEFFSAQGDIVRLPGRKISAADLRDADVLLVRSVTKVNEALLANSRVRFVGSCTIGTDHLDTHWLDNHNIAWAHAPGCNAEAVVDYVIACLFALDVDLKKIAEGEFVIGVVGCGNVGSRLVKRLQKLGATVLCCDPFKRSAHYIPLEELLPHCDMVCLHTPLTHGGKYPTRHLIHQDNLPLFKNNAVLLNAGRGAVVDNTALLAHLETHPDFRVVLDVWEYEPDILRTLLQCAYIATPHIAGYSIEGKRRGTEMIYAAFCKYFHIKHQATVDPEEKLEFDATHFATLRDLVLACCDPLKDSEELKHAPQSFDQLRKLYIYRREFSQCRIRKVPENKRALLRALGFNRNRT